MERLSNQRPRATTSIAPGEDSLSLKIDLHTHILPQQWPDLAERYGYDGFVTIEHHQPCCARLWKDGKFFREVDDR